MDSSQIDEVLRKYPDVKGNVIAILHGVQAAYHYLPESALRYVAKQTGVPLTRLYSIATFYHFFSLTPKGRHELNVCLGTACHVKGSRRVMDEVEQRLSVEEGGTTGDMRFTLRAVRCIGACSLAPVMVVDKDTYSNVTAKKAVDILKKYD